MSPVSLQLGQGTRRNKKFDAARLSGLATDQAFALELEHHAMDRRRRDAEEALHVGIRGRLWWLDMGARGERWEKTPFRAQRDELVDMVIDQFPWTVDDVLANPERT